MTTSSYCESIEKLLDTFVSNDCAATSIYLIDRDTDLRWIFKVSYAVGQLSFVLQFPHFSKVSKEFIMAIFTEINTKKHDLLLLENVTVIRFVVQYVTRDERHGFLMHNAFPSLQPGWLINVAESVACFGRVDIMIKCDVTNAKNERSTKDFILWVNSNLAIEDLRYEVQNSGLIDGSEFTVGDFFTKTHRDAFGDDTLISDIITSFTLVEDIRCFVVPDDSILM